MLALIGRQDRLFHNVVRLWLAVLLIKILENVCLSLVIRRRKTSFWTSLLFSKWWEFVIFLIFLRLLLVPTLIWAACARIVAACCVLYSLLLRLRFIFLCWQVGSHWWHPKCKVVYLLNLRASLYIIWLTRLENFTVVRVSLICAIIQCFLLMSWLLRSLRPRYMIELALRSVSLLSLRLLVPCTLSRWDWLSFPLRLKTGWLRFNCLHVSSGVLSSTWIHALF